LNQLTYHDTAYQYYVTAAHTNAVLSNFYSQNLAHIEPVKLESHILWSYKASEEKYESFVKVVLSRI
jgi:hypothetical protein